VLEQEVAKRALASRKSQVWEGEHRFVSQKSLRSELGGQNSPWRTQKIVRAIGSCIVARWLEVSEPINRGFEGQYKSLISSQPKSLDHFVNSGFMNSKGRPNS
jgi:hypothetical protein